MSSLDLRLYQKIEQLIGEQLERHAAELITGKAQSYDDYRYRTGVLKGLRDALAISKEAHDEVLGVKHEER